MLQCIAEAGLAGEYFSSVKIAVMLILVVPWLMVSPWVHRDSKLIHAPEHLWSIAILGVGAVGLFVWMIMPIYALGLMIYLVSVVATLGVYIIYRNGRCEKSIQIFTLGSFSSLFGKAKAKSVKLTTSVKLYDNHGKIVLQPGDESTEAERLAYNATQKFLFELLYYRASEAAITPAGQQARVQFVIDGMLTERKPLELTDSEAIIQYLKTPAELNIEERRQPQKGNISVDIAGKPMDMVLTTAGTTGGQRMLFRMVQEAVRTNLDELGMSRDVLQRLRKSNKHDTGILIVSGKPSSGVTSTLYSLLRERDAFIKQLVTLESKPAADMENITQNDYSRDADLPKTLASVIRHDPDVILVDNCPDAETANLIIQASEEKFILLGMQARDSFVALARWVKVCGNTEAATKNLRGISCQALLRKLCHECRQPYRPDPQMLAKANISGQKIDNFYREPKGPRLDEKGNPLICPNCQESGFYGRTGVFEFLDVTDDIRELIVSETNLQQIKAACRKNKMLNLQEQALKKVIAGTTSIKEVIRVTQKK